MQRETGILDLFSIAGRLESETLGLFCMAGKVGGRWSIHLYIDYFVLVLFDYNDYPSFDINQSIFISNI